MGRAGVSWADPRLNPSHPHPSGSDGLLKLWTIKNNECVRTLDAHEDKVWGLHCSRLDDRALTGASDSCVILWKVCGPGRASQWAGQRGGRSKPSVTPL